MPKGTQKVTLEGRQVGDRIRRAMKLAKGGEIIQAELARRTGIRSSTLGNYIQGTRRLPIREARRIEHAIGVPAAFILTVLDEADIPLLTAPKGAREAMLKLLETLSKSNDPFEKHQENPPRRQSRGA